MEGALHQAEGACQREKELRAELQRLQKEVAQLQEAHRHKEVEHLALLKLIRLGFLRDTMGCDLNGDVNKKEHGML